MITCKWKKWKWHVAKYGYPYSELVLCIYPSKVYTHSTCALVSEILESVLHIVQKQFTYRQYILTDLYWRQCAEYTYIYSVHTVYY